MKNRRIDFFTKMSKEVSKLSTCVSFQVGCLLTKDISIVAMAYNGVASEKKHCNQIFDPKNFNREKHHEWSMYNELHAEQNLISFCAKHGICTQGCNLFVTLSPCIHCAKMIYSAGIKAVYYIEKYDMEDGLDFLKKNKVKCIKVKLKN